MHSARKCNKPNNIILMLIPACNFLKVFKSNNQSKIEKP